MGEADEAPEAASAEGAAEPEQPEAARPAPEATPQEDAGPEPAETATPRLVSDQPKPAASDAPAAEVAEATRPKRRGWWSFGG